MAKPLVSDALWERIEPLIPPEPEKPRGGRPRCDDRAVLTGVLFVLKTGIGWEYLPQEMGCGSGMTCWRRLRDWQAAGVWDRLHRVLLDELGPTGSTGPARRWTLPAYEQKGGPADGPEPDGSWKARDQAAPDRRRQRHPAGRRADPGQRPRVEHVAADARQDPQHQTPARSSETPACQTARRQGVRPRLLPRRLPDSRRCTPHRPSWHRIGGASGALPLGGGALVRLAPQLPSARDSLRTPRRHPSRFPLARRRPHLLQLRCSTVLLGVLRRF